MSPPSVSAFLTHQALGEVVERPSWPSARHYPQHVASVVEELRRTRVGRVRVRGGTE
jgi:hypothetical protein